MYEITRRLNFCYGHRLIDHGGKCAHLHGHNGQVEVTLGASQLDNQGMVVDFQVIRQRLGAWIDATLDHRMILQTGDPALTTLLSLGEPIYEVDFPPTAENLAKHLLEKAREFELPVRAVRFQETPSCHATYRLETDPA